MFSDYESVFASPLPPATFATYVVPSSVPPPERLVSVARVVYPFWKERKVEREGKRVVPQLDVCLPISCHGCHETDLALILF